MSRIKSTYSNIFSGYILGKNRAISFVLNPLHNWAKGTSVKKLRQSHRPWRIGRDRCGQVFHKPFRGGTITRKKTRPRRRTNRKLAICPLKQHAFRGQLVNIRGQHRLVAIAPQLRPQVINRNEKHIPFWGSSFGLCGLPGRQSARQRRHRHRRRARRHPFQSIPSIKPIHF